MPFAELYQQIDDLSAEIATLTKKDEFEHVDAKLSLRLELLKTLTKQVRETNSEALESKLQAFLRKIQAQDNIQVELLLKERAKSLADGQKQSKKKKAVNTYQKVSNN